MINGLKKVDMNIQKICYYIINLHMALMFSNELFAIERFIVMFVSYEFVVAMNIG